MLDFVSVTLSVLSVVYSVTWEQRTSQSPIHCMCTQTWSVKLILILIRNIFIFLQKCSSHAYFKGEAFSVLAESLDFIFFSLHECGSACRLAFTHANAFTDSLWLECVWPPASTWTNCGNNIHSSINMAP